MFKSLSLQTQSFCINAAFPFNVYLDPDITQRNTTLKQRRFNVLTLNHRWIDVVSMMCADQDVESTLFQRCVPPGYGMTTGAKF